VRDFAPYSVDTSATLLGDLFVAADAPPPPGVKVEFMRGG
jgi:hypothetical protein